MRVYDMDYSQFIKFVEHNKLVDYFVDSYEGSLADYYYYDLPRYVVLVFEKYLNGWSSCYRVEIIPKAHKNVCRREIELWYSVKRECDEADLMQNYYRHTPLEKILKQFNKEYTFLYENNDNVAGYDETVCYYEEHQEDLQMFVGYFSKYRGDLITSDREIAALMFALETLDLLD